MIEENKIKIKARSIVNYSLKKGVIKKQPCVKCGNNKSEGHHEDYNKPLEIIWLCHSCHILHHRIKDGLHPVARIFCHKCRNVLSEDRKGKYTYCKSCEKLVNWANYTVKKFLKWSKRM